MGCPEYVDFPGQAAKGQRYRGLARTHPTPHTHNPSERAPDGLIALTSSEISPSGCPARTSHYQRDVTIDGWRTL